MTDPSPVPAPMTFPEAVAAISALEGRGWRLGLDRIRAFLDLAGLGGALGESPGSPRYLHVAGTNGKGSTTAYLHAMLRGQGWRTGAFFSPYVYTVRERVQGDGLIPPEAFAALTARLLPVARAMEATEFGGPTEFEFKTALGFAWWAETRADWVALEVGLGGRLDSTNVVAPAACGIVSIGWDHMAILGDTLELIAGEKAGIVKPGAPVVVGRMAEGPRGVIEAIAAERGAPCWRLDREVRLEPESEDRWTVITPNAAYRGLRPGLRGAVQPHNLALAVAMMDAGGAIREPAALAPAAQSAYAPGRFERTERDGVAWILDGAHNLDSAEELARTLAAEGFRRGALTLLTTMLQGHDPAPFYRILAPWVARCHVATVDFHRARPPAEFAAELAALGLDAVPHARLADAMAAAADDARRLGAPVLTTGSFYLVGDVGRALGLAGPEPI